MDFQAFELILGELEKELTQQGFQAPSPVDDENGRAVMFSAADVAYKLLYDKKKQRFELCSTTLDSDGKPTQWRSLSLWLFDESQGTKADATSIANDFLDVVRGPKRVEIVNQKKKRNKNDDRNVDPLFFFNRLVGVFPELKDDMNQERIVYGQIRFATLAREKIAPRCEDLAKQYSDSELCKKLCALFSDMYKDGDLDVRSILTFSILNQMSDTAFAAIRDHLSPELQKDTDYTRKLIGKEIKPEKPKKKSKVVSRLGDK